MAIIKAFRGYRPSPDLVFQVASVPYDVVSTPEARELAGENPHSFLRVLRPEIEFEDGQNPYADEVYEKAKNNFSKLIEQGSLVQDEEPAIYLYRLSMPMRGKEGGEQIQTGIVACSSVDEYEAGLIKIHEKTRPEKENDRTRHMIELEAHPGPVFLAYREVEELNSLVEAETQAEPLYDFVSNDNVRHTFWKAVDSQAICEAFKAVPQTYVADGHHRAASASRCRDEMKKRNPGHTGEESYNFFLTVLFPDTQLQILPYNRIVRKIPSPPEQILIALREVYEVEEDAGPVPKFKGDVHMYLAGKWYRLSLFPNEAKPYDVVEALDVSILHNRALAPIFGIGDPRQDKNLDFVGGIRGSQELERLVDGGEAEAAFSMFSVSMYELFSVADEGKLMAPKSTWFEPKLRSGIIVHRFNEK